MAHTNPVVNGSNMTVLSHFGAIMWHYMNVRGLSDAKVANGVGCGTSTIFKLRHGHLEYCGISLLSRICLYFGFVLSDWLNPVHPNSVVSPFASSPTKVG